MNDWVPIQFTSLSLHCRLRTFSRCYTKVGNNMDNDTMTENGKCQKSRCKVWRTMKQLARKEKRMQ